MAPNFPGFRASKESSSPPPPGPPPGPPPAPPAIGSTEAGGVPKRKRITQRLVLGGKSTEGAGESHTGRIRLPGAPEPKVDLPSHNEVEGDIPLPVYVLLQCIPAEFLTSDHETLFASAEAQEEAAIPLRLILPGLPSGRVEIPLQQIAVSMPAGIIRPDEELGEYVQSPIQLPLPDVIQRIPAEYLTLRYDQKPIDPSVADLDDPFSIEALQAAANEQAQATSAESTFEDAAYGDDPETPEPHAEEVSTGEVEEDYPDPETMDTGVPEETPESGIGEPLTGEPEEAEPDLPEPSPWQEPEAEPEIPAAPGQEETDTDLSFTKTEAFKQFLQENEEGAFDEPNVDPGLAVTELLDESPDEEDDRQAGVPSPEDSPPEPVAPSPPDADQGSSQEEGPPGGPSDAGKDMGTKETIPIDVPARPQPALTPPEPKEAPKAPRLPKLQPKSTATPVKGPPPFQFKMPGKPAESEKAEVAPSAEVPSADEEPANRPQAEKAEKAEKAYTVSRDPSISKTSKMSSPAAQAVVEISDELRRALRLNEEQRVTLRDIVHQINCWPGMEGCILGGKDGLTITSEIEDERFGNSLSAFAPKILGRLNELFRDLGFASVEEIQTPMEDGSVFIFRFEELFFIALSGEANMPLSYRQLIKDIIKELAQQRSK